MTFSPGGLRELLQKCAVSLVLSVAVLAGVGSARAAEIAGGTLTVTRDSETADCPDDTALAGATLALGTPPAERSEGGTVRVVFQRDAFGYGALVTTTGPEGGVREIRKPGPTCAPLTEAVAVVLAVIFDLAPREGPPTDAAEPPPAPPVAPLASAPAPEPNPARPPRPPAEPPQPPGPELTFGLGAQGGLAYGLLGGAVTVAASGALRPSLDRWELGVGALGAPNRTVEYIGRVVYVSLVAGRLGGCGWLFASRSRPDFGVCAGLLLGRLRARGEGFDDDAPVVTNLWLAGEAGAAARFPITRNIALRLGISLIVPAWRQRYRVSPLGNAFESSPAAGLLEAGPELRFP